MLLLLFQQATGAYAVTADAGVHALAGQDAGLVATRIMPSDVGVYALSGQDATLSRGRTLVSDAAAYALAGRDASLLSARRVSSDVGAYALSGQDATLAYGRVVVSDVGAYVLTGLDAGLVYSGGAQPSQPMAPISVGREKRAWTVDGHGAFAVKEPHSWAVLGAGQSEIALDSHVWRVPRAGGSS